MGFKLKRAVKSVSNVADQAQDTGKQIGQGVQNTAKAVRQQAINTAQSTPLGSLINRGSTPTPDILEAPRAAAAKNFLKRKQAGAGQISYTSSDQI